MTNEASKDMTAKSAYHARIGRRVICEDDIKWLQRVIYRLSDCIKIWQIEYNVENMKLCKAK